MTPPPNVNNIDVYHFTPAELKERGIRCCRARWKKP